jgi:type II secretory pathway pseudopilin PulG
MPRHADKAAMAPAWKDESGWTLVELLVGLVMSLAIAGSALLVLQTTLHAQKETGSRLAAQDDGSFAMLRMTKDIRTAIAATVQDSRTLDLLVPERNPAGGAPIPTHVRYACVGMPGSCARYTCGTPFTSNSCGAPARVLVIVGGVANSDNFQGVSMGVAQPTATPATTPATWTGTGSPGADNVGFVSVHLQVLRTEDAGAFGSNRPLDFHDGADLANFTN